jgi:DNA-binding Lrp family transcriptional regulator
MDERILNILHILEADDSLSQREISRRTNISLGQLML